MESKKVKEFIDGHVAVGLLQFTAADIEYCVNMAEQEIREGVRTSDSLAVAVDTMNYRVAAVEAFRQVCPCRSDKYCTLTRQILNEYGDGHMEECHVGCNNSKQFTNHLGELIRKMND